MGERATDPPPADGWLPWPRTSPFGDVAGPLVHRRRDDGLEFGLRLEERHANARGHAHGGVIATLADLSPGYAAAFSTHPPTRLTTASLTVDYLAPAAVGELLTVRPTVSRLGRQLAFVVAEIHADGRLVANARSVLNVRGQD